MEDSAKKKLLKYLTFTAPEVFAHALSKGLGY